MEPAFANGGPPPEQQPAPAMVVREQDCLMPIANVIRIMRRVLPPHAKISDDAKEVIQECVSEFISFVTGEANDRCHREHRKTVTAEDLVWAMDRLGFDDYVPPLGVYLRRMRESEGGGPWDNGKAMSDRDRQRQVTWGLVATMTTAGSDHGDRGKVISGEGDDDSDDGIDGDDEPVADARMED
uniref:Transcription factor CBF/NF-Y/archaeal histone domain-containing protein n=1 Tax=Oryza brachyantha TaxID=4533 RepID=J3MDB2_ORYBR